MALDHRSSFPPHLFHPAPHQVLDSIARKHRSSIPNVASKWVLDRPGVAGIILGARNADHVQVGLLEGRAKGGGGPTKWMLERPGVACQNSPEFGRGMPIMSSWGSWTGGQNGGGRAVPGLASLSPPSFLEGKRGPRLPYQQSASPGPPPPPLRRPCGSLCS